MHIIANIASAAMQACAIAQYLSDETDYGQAEHDVIITQLLQSQWAGVPNTHSTGGLPAHAHKLRQLVIGSIWREHNAVLVHWHH